VDGASLAIPAAPTPAIQRFGAFPVSTQTAEFVKKSQEGRKGVVEVFDAPSHETWVCKQQIILRLAFSCRDKISKPQARLGAKR